MTIIDIQPKSFATIRHVALDMDGTIYKGSELFPFTVPFLNLMRELGIGCTFLTNNSSKSASDYLKHLAKMGIDADVEQMYTSGLATIDYLKAYHPDAQSIYLLGTPSLREEFARAGYTLIDGDSAEPDAVVVAFDTNLPFERLCKASYWIAQGKLYVATHPDYVCPTNLPTVLVDCGAICHAIYAATGRQPDAIPGKPDPRMLEGVLRRHNLNPYELAMVGDRLYTDIAMARNSGAIGVLVLTGEATLKDLDMVAEKPDFVLESIEVLGRELAAAHR